MQPMLPDTYASHKIIYPVLVQPYFKGIRTLYQDGAFQSECDWPAEISSIALDLKHIFPEKVVLDGVMHEGDYHVFDLVAFKTPFKDRFDAATQVLRDTRKYHRVLVVPTRKMFTDKQADDQFDMWLNEGRTGMIYRLGNCYYTRPSPKNKENRSKQMLLREIK